MNYKVFENIDNLTSMTIESLKKMNLLNEDTRTLLHLFTAIRIQKTQVKIEHHRLLAIYTTYSRNLLTERNIKDYFDEFLWENEDKYNTFDSVKLEVLKNKFNLLEESHSYVKSILDTRENIKNKTQRKEHRQKKAKLGKSGSNKSKSR